MFAFPYRSVVGNFYPRSHVGNDKQAGLEEH